MAHLKLHRVQEELRESQTGFCGVSADFAQVRANGIIDLETAKNGLDMLAIDELGLDAVDRNMLTAMIVKFGGRPVGLDTIAAATR